ncbi:hypothetical protein AC579_10562 [Pseudocercospora musae]|uniref:Uncharacterized protein n=1 Tax=Pseudocercospora musae TaxID=113226 RepID=A0A139I0C3_9PEZI|nr:hypothetical protein AC579_10562 [Pseudocercospora musae]
MSQFIFAGYLSIGVQTLGDRNISETTRKRRQMSKMMFDTECHKVARHKLARTHPNGGMQQLRIDDLPSRGSAKSLSTSWRFNSVVSVFVSPGSWAARKREPDLMFASLLPDSTGLELLELLHRTQ